MGAAASAAIERGADSVRARQTIAARKKAMALHAEADLLDLNRVVRRAVQGRRVEPGRRRRSLWKRGMDSNEATVGDDY